MSFRTYTIELSMDKMFDSTQTEFVVSLDRPKFESIVRQYAKKIIGDVVIMTLDEFAAEQGKDDFDNMCHELVHEFDIDEDDYSLYELYSDIGEDL